MSIILWLKIEWIVHVCELYVERLFSLFIIRQQIWYFPRCLVVLHWDKLNLIEVSNDIPLIVLLLFFRHWVCCFQQNVSWHEPLDTIKHLSLNNNFLINKIVFWFLKFIPRLWYLNNCLVLLDLPSCVNQFIQVVALAAYQNDQNCDHNPNWKPDVQLWMSDWTSNIILPVLLRL